LFERSQFHTGTSHAAAVKELEESAV